MAYASKALLLKVLSGHHVGAEILLVDGEQTIGSGENCDLILNDQGIAEEHAVLENEGQTVFLSPCGGSRVQLGGTTISDRVTVEWFDCFTLGTTHLAVGPRDETWPDIALPVGNSAAAEEKPENDDPINDSDQALQSSPDESEETDQSPQTAALETAPVAETSKVSFASKHVKTILPATVILLLLVTISIILHQALDNADAPAATPVDLHDIKKLVAELAPDSDVQVISKRDSFHVLGCVSTEQIEQNLCAAIRSLDPAIDVDLVNNDDLVSATHAELKMYGKKFNFDLAASGGNPGEIIIDGIVENDGDWDLIRKAILHDVVHIQTLNDSGVHTQNEEPVFEEVVRPQTEPILESLVTTTAPPTPAIESTPIAPLQLEEPRDRAVIDTPETTEIVEPETESIAVRTVICGSQRKLVVLSDGTRIFEGAYLGNSKLKSVSRDHLVLTRNGQDRTVLLGAL